MSVSAINESLTLTSRCISCQVRVSTPLLSVTSCSGAWRQQEELWEVEEESKSMYNSTNFAQSFKWVSYEHLAHLVRKYSDDYFHIEVYKLLGRSKKKPYKLCDNGNEAPQCQNTCFSLSVKPEWISDIAIQFTCHMV